MKVILNVDIKSLGEEGDVKNVANGYYRNFLHPRNMAVPYTPDNIAIFEARKEQIEARKEEKRQNARSTKEKLQALHLEATLPAGPNGKLYGAVTVQTVIEMLAKEGFEFERKRIEIPGLAIKSVGNYHFTVKLYEAETAEVKISIKAQEEEKKPAPEKTDKRRRYDRNANVEKTDDESADETSSENAADTTSENA